MKFSAGKVQEWSTKEDLQSIEKYMRFTFGIQVEKLRN